MQKTLLTSPRGKYIMILLIATLTTLPWIGAGDYYTKGEPREASVAVSMINDGNWILPRVYADEIAYKPPLMHWMVAICSLPAGEVSPFTSRLPSAIAFIFMIGCCFGFFNRFLKKHESLIAIFILITCFELHRSSMTSRVDMLLTAFMVCGLISLFYWMEDKQLKGLPWHIPLLLGCAALVKGPVGIILPVGVFGVYLLVIRQKFITIVLKCLLITLLSFIPLFVWYYLAYLQAGESFINLVWAENFGRFLGSDNLNIHYPLGHQNPFWINFVYLLAGFLPWALFLLFSLFTVRYKSGMFGGLWKKISSLERGKLFSLIAACLIVIFYCIPMSKRGVYLMPAYPFIAVFLARLIYTAVNKHTWVNQAFALFWGVVSGVVVVLSLSALFGVLKLQDLVLFFTDKDKTLFHATLINDALSTPKLFYLFLLLCFIIISGILVFQFRKRNQKGILYATTGLLFMCNLLMDSVILPVFKDGTSIKPFIHEIANKYPLEKGNMYVVNNLHEYRNLYGTNFYLNNNFLSFEKEQPEEGFFFSTSVDIEKIRDVYKEYLFNLLEETPNRYNDSRSIVQLYKFSKLTEKE